VTSLFHYIPFVIRCSFRTSGTGATRRDVMWCDACLSRPLPHSSDSLKYVNTRSRARVHVYQRFSRVHVSVAFAWTSLWQSRSDVGGAQENDRRRCDIVDSGIARRQRRSGKKNQEISSLFFLSLARSLSFLLCRGFRKIFSGMHPYSVNVYAIDDYRSAPLAHNEQLFVDATYLTATNISRAFIRRRASWRFTYTRHMIWVLSIYTFSTDID